MRNMIFCTFVLLTSSIFAQSEQSSIFEESFTGMFEIEPVEPYIPEGVQGPSNPAAVPLDAGLTALLVAGGAVGYRKYRARSKKWHLAYSHQKKSPELALGAFALYKNLAATALGTCRTARSTSARSAFRNHCKRVRRR